MQGTGEEHPSPHRTQRLLPARPSPRLPPPPPTTAGGKRHKPSVSADNNTAAVVDSVSPFPSSRPLSGRDCGAAGWDGGRQRLGWHQGTVALIFKRCFSPPKTHYQQESLRYCKDIYAYPFEHLNFTIQMLRFGFVLRDAHRRALHNLSPEIHTGFSTSRGVSRQPSVADSAVTSARNPNRRGMHFLG